jgi:hypothetical protein
LYTIANIFPGNGDLYNTTFKVSAITHYEIPD